MIKHADEPTYYDVLHVSRDAPVEIIRVSYRTLMQKLRNHPDLGGDMQLAARINEAYAILKNDKLRAEYDAKIDSRSTVMVDVPVHKSVSAAMVQARVKRSMTRVIDLSRECGFCSLAHNHGNCSDPLISCRDCQSPLSSARYRSLNGSEQRAIERIDKRQKIRFFDQWPQLKPRLGHAENISLSGMKFVTKHKLLAGQNIKIVSGVLEAIATVARFEQERTGWRKRYVVGVSFLTLRFSRSVGGFVSAQI